MKTNNLGPKNKKRPTSYFTILSTVETNKHF